MTIAIPADLADHEAGQRDLAGWPRCSACGFRWPCPDLRMALPEQTAAEAEVVALVDAGWTIWRALPQADQGWSDADRPGGVVVGWRDDPDGHRTYRCLDWPRGRHHYHDLPAAEVDVADCSLPNAASLRSHARRLARDFSQRKGIVSAYDLALLEDAVALIRSVA